MAEKTSKKTAKKRRYLPRVAGLTHPERACEIYQRLREAYPDADCTLNGSENPWYLLVGAILAAQCTDERVNQVTPALFAAYPDIPSMAKATQAEVESYVRSCGLYRNKAKNMIACAQVLTEHYGAQVPETQAELESLPGVGRKIANLLVGDVFGGQAIVVDTHCKRLAQRMGLTQEERPEAVERDLMKVLPEAFWAHWGHLLVAHGRAVCDARRPNCAACVCLDLCPYGLKQQQMQAEPVTKRSAKETGGEAL